MIPVKDTLTQIDELPGEEIAFGIGDPRWVMRTQADLYSDITTAIIREYSTNAYDAHVMAGHDDPIEVTLPSILEPNFIVEDHGVGMSIETFRAVYTQFGVSDKRESNSTNGMLGYGSKSGIAYTTSFQVTSVCDGIKIHGVVLRKPDWSIVLKVVSTTKTDEPNGTRIVIPVHNVNEFIAKAHDFYRYWLPGRVLVNGAEPAHNVGEKIVDGLYYSTGLNSYVVMGNVPYRINNPSALFYNVSMRSINFVAYVDNGDVEFTPSREDLAYTDHTKNALQKIVEDFETDIVTKAKSDVLAATTHAEAFAAWHKWNSLVGGALGNLSFRGDAFSPTFSINAQHYHISNYRNSVVRTHGYNVVAMPTTMVITEYTNVMSSKNKQMARDYAKQMDWKITDVLFTAQSEADIKSVWIPRDKFVTYADLKAALPKAPKMPRVSTHSTRPKGSWDYYNNTGYNSGKPLPDYDDGTLFFTGVKYDSTDLRIMREALGDDTIVVIVPQNRKNKFLRENPTAKSITTAASALVNRDESAFLSDDAKSILSLNHGTRRWINALDTHKINDPRFAKHKTLIQNESKILAAREKNATLAKACGLWYNLKRYEPVDAMSLYDHYPLLSNLSVYNIIPDIYLYINAKYAESENNNE